MTYVKKACTPVTLLMIPHSNKKPFNIKIPLICIIALTFFWIVGTVYTLFTAVSSVQYQDMKGKLSYYTNEFNELRTNMVALKKAEEQFRYLFSLGSRDAILKNLEASDSGNIDLSALKNQIQLSMTAVGEIRSYIKHTRDIFVATPKGFPVATNISSPYGQRVNPMNQDMEFHSGVDLSAPQGTPIHATADGIISFAGWSGGSGLLVVIEHGFDMTTCYGHATQIIVKVGEKVKRGQIMGYVGSTGSSTGPHVHYEIWVKGKTVNPSAYI
jgi:murein DD-endopeptidase MepM/ murein hydrolase activator NlpD